MTQNKLATSPNNSLARVGHAANHAAKNYIFADYRQRRSAATLSNQFAALTLWVEYLGHVGAGGELLAAANNWCIEQMSQSEQTAVTELAEERGIPAEILYGGRYCQHVPAAWFGVTWGLVNGFIIWLLDQGYSLASVNNRLSAVRVYARLATKAGIIPTEEAALIREVRGYGRTEGRRVNQKRKATRVGHKKEEAIVLTVDQARQLKRSHDNTPQGIRDRLLCCLLLDLGLRASEASGLAADDINGRYITVYRQKTDTTDQLRITSDIRQALADYNPYLRANGRLLRGSTKTGKLTNANMSTRAISARIKILGRDILGIWELSPHDLRHTWATIAAKKSNPFALRDAGGWSNMQTPSRYVERNRVANDGIELQY